MVLCWIPSHVGIYGNEQADTAAKTALSLWVTPWKYQLLILFLVLSWSLKMATILEHLYRKQATTIRPTVGGRQQKPSLSRRDEVVINRLRIGPTRCTHSYLLTGADQPECTTCQCPVTVKHILIECTDFNDTRTKYFVTSSLEEFFRTVDVHNVLDFIKETQFLQQVIMLLISF